MKKKLSLLLCLVAAIFSLFALASGDSIRTHRKGGFSALFSEHSLAVRKAQLRSRSLKIF